MFRFCRRNRKAPFIICLVLIVLVTGFHSLRIPLIRNREFSTQDTLATVFGRRSHTRRELVYLSIDGPSVLLDQFDPEIIKSSPALTLMKQGWPWPREVYPLIIERLINAGADVIGIDLMFPTPREGDAALRDSLDKYRDHVVVASNFVQGNRENGGTKTLQLPAGDLIQGTAPLDNRIGFVNYWPDSDEVIRWVYYRRTMTSVYGDPPEEGEEIFDSFPAKILDKSGHGSLIPPPGPHRIRFAGPSLTFSPHSVCDLFDDAKWKSPEYSAGDFFRGKIVILGPEGNFLKDVVRTPFKQMPGPEMHLNSINAALNSDFVTEPPEIVNLLLIAFAGAIVCALGEWFPAPLIRLALIVFACMAWIVVAQLFYNFASLVILTFCPLIVMSSGGVCGLAWDFFMERREKARIRGTLERYVSRQAVKEIIDNPGGFLHTLGGERKAVAILFTDLRGFTSMTEHAEDHHALLSQLNEYLGAMVEPILANNGALDKYIGDAIMAAWGNIQSRGSKEDVRCAVIATLRMRESLAVLNKSWLAEGKMPLAMGMGINYGDVIVGNVGSKLQMNLTIIGDAVNLASRIEGVTKEYGVDLLLGEDAAAQVRELFYMQSAGLVQVKGRRKPVELFFVIGEREATPDKELEEYLETYAGGMALYMGGKFENARIQFEKAFLTRPGDVLSRVYSSRCETLAKEPLLPDWNGVYVMTKK